MSNFQTLTPAIQGVPGSAPRIYSGVTTDSYDQVIAVGYLNDLGGLVKDNDYIYLNYVDTSTEPPGENSMPGLFIVNVSGGNTSLQDFFAYKSAVKAGISGNVANGTNPSSPISVPGLNTSSVVVAQVVSSSNPVSIVATAVSGNQFTVTPSASPGASFIVSYIAYVYGQ